MIKIVQINLNHCPDTQVLLQATAAELSADIIAVADPLWNPGGGWEFGKSHGAAIWVTNFNGRRVLDQKTLRARFHVAVVIDDLMVVSCYLRPLSSMQEFEDEVTLLQEIRREWRGPTLFCGDFNAKSPAWGSRTMDHRGAVLLDAIGRMDLFSIRATGCTHTFMSGRGRTSVIDFAFYDAATLRTMGKSEILAGVERRLDHRYVVHTLRTPVITIALSLFKWNAKSLDVGRMKRRYGGPISSLDPTRTWNEKDVHRYLWFCRTLVRGR